MRLSILLLVLLLASGCGTGEDGPERVVVSGRVTWNGEPMESGKLRFVPAEGTTGPVTVALIENGRYTADTRGGVPVGNHRVEFESYRAMPGAAPISEKVASDFADMEAGQTAQEQYLPAKYVGRGSTVTATVEFSEEPLQRDFHLEEQPAD